MHRVGNDTRNPFFSSSKTQITEKRINCEMHDLNYVTCVCKKYLQEGVGKSYLNIIMNIGFVIKFPIKRKQIQHIANGNFMQIQMHAEHVNAFIYNSGT